jgi:hypothetical protein
MTPEERFEAHEQWLLDHDRTMRALDEASQKHAEEIAAIREILQETTAIQRKQSAVLLEIAEHVARLLDKENDDEEEA